VNQKFFKIKYTLARVNTVNKKKLKIIAKSSPRTASVCNVPLYGTDLIGCQNVIFYGESILEIFASFALDKYVCYFLVKTISR